METEILIAISDHLKRDRATRMIVNYWIRNSTLIYCRHFFLIRHNDGDLLRQILSHLSRIMKFIIRAHPPQSLNVLSKQNAVVIMKNYFSGRHKTGLMTPKCWAGAQTRGLRVRLVVGSGSQAAETIGE